MWCVCCQGACPLLLEFMQVQSLLAGVPPYVLNGQKLWSNFSSRSAVMLPQRALLCPGLYCFGFGSLNGKGSLEVLKIKISKLLNA